jgi:hypothetical protein
VSHTLHLYRLVSFSTHSTTWHHSACFHFAQQRW